MLNKTIFSLFLILGVACSPTKKTILAPKSTKSMVMAVILELQASNHGTETMVKLLNTVKSGGHVKTIQDQPANFEFRFVDNQSHTITALYKQINLTKVYEYVDDKGQLAKKVMDGESVVVSVRTNYQPEMKKMIVYQMINENFEPIATFLLNPKNQ